MAIAMGFRSSSGGRTAGYRVRRWRTESALSQEEAAQLLKISQSHLSRIETDQVGVGVEMALRLERVSRGAVPVSVWASKRDLRRRRAA